MIKRKRSKMKQISTVSTLPFRRLKRTDEKKSITPEF